LEKLTHSLCDGFFIEPMDSLRFAPQALVISDGGDIPAAIAAPDEIELAFMQDDAPALNSASLAPDIVVAEHLAHAVAAAPGNLLRHTQRVFFHYRADDADGLYSALFDLFTALREKGRRLRRRLLFGAQPKLLPEQFEALNLWLSQAAPPDEKLMPKASAAVLSSGVEGACALVEVIEGAKLAQRDPLLEAREYIEYSQIEEARELLESAVLDAPDREDLQAELLHLYLATRDFEHFRAMREKLTELITSLPDYWQTLGEKTSGGD
jgi:hypothetical protein